MNPNTSVSPIRQKLIYIFMSIGLFLFVFIGGKAVGEANDRRYVDGQRQLYVNGTRMTHVGTAEWLKASNATPMSYKSTATAASSNRDQSMPPNNKISKPEIAKVNQQSPREEKTLSVQELAPVVRYKLDKAAN